MRIVCGLLLLLLTLPAAATARVGGGQGFSFVWPADGILTSPFGARPGGFHPGVDIGLLQGLEVRAASPGRVVDAGALPGYEGYGNVVVVDLGDGYTTVNEHLAKP